MNLKNDNDNGIFAIFAIIWFFVGSIPVLLLSILFGGLGMFIGTMIFLLVLIILATLGSSGSANDIGYQPSNYELVQALHKSNARMNRNTDLALISPSCSSIANA